MVRSTALIVTLAATLAACEQRDPLYCGMHMDDPRCSFGDGGLPEGYFVVGGTVKNLNGGGLVLENNGGDDKAISSSGAFTFPTPVMQGQPYSVTVSNEPTNPSEMCTVANGSGTANADVTDVEVTCMPAAYTVGGSVTAGFTAGGNIVVTNNGVDDKTITASGAFTFATPIVSGHPYDVEIKSSTAETCSAVANIGTVGSGPVTTVVIVCGANNFTVGGTPPQGGVTGLNGSVKLHNGGDTITVNANGAFAFPTPIVGGGTNTYAVTVTQQPAYPPAAQNCVVSNGSGTVGTTNVTNVGVACTTKTFTVGGMISGLNGGTIVLKNGSDMTSVTTSPFTMTNPVASGTTYSISIMTQPAGESCTITSGGSGTVQNANVTNVMINCVPIGVKCGLTSCSAGSQVCCDPETFTPSCKTSAQCNGVEFACDDSADCSTGQVCCVQRHSGNNNIELSKCNPNNCNNVSGGVQLCDPAKNDCPGGQQCRSYFGPYYRCQ